MCIQAAQGPDGPCCLTQRDQLLRAFPSLLTGFGVPAHACYMCPVAAQHVAKHAQGEGGKGCAPLPGSFS